MVRGKGRRCSPGKRETEYKGIEDKKEDMTGQYERLGVNKGTVKSCEKGLDIIIWYFTVIIRLKISELC